MSWSMISTDFHVGTHRLTTNLDAQLESVTGSMCSRATSKSPSEHFYLKPGMMVELEVLNDGELNYVYDGPMPAPRTEEA